MNEGFTYELNVTGKLETYEWDNLWWEHANDAENKPRALIIGDSISCGYRGFVNEALGGSMYADGLGTSKSLDNPHFTKLIDYVAGQQQRCKVIQFNNGLHGWHLSEEAYKAYYEQMVHYLKENYGDRKLLLVLSTPVRVAGNLSQLAERNDIVIERNRAVCEIAQKEGIEVLDLYSLVIDHPEYHSADGVHLTEEGYRLLAKTCVEAYAE